MDQSSPAIVIVAYNRPDSLNRLLGSLLEAQYDIKDIPLIISIDKSNSDSVQQVAETFKWPFGVKKVILHPENLGLRQHILTVGDLVITYGSIIMLEDDLYVSPFFYIYAYKALDFYKDEHKIAGIALYKIERTENTYDRFNPIESGFDNYFLQLPCSWGQAWTASQWSDFKQFMDQVYTKDTMDVLPKYIQYWSERSWKKLYAIYLIKTGRYFVYPRFGLSTNFNPIGANNTNRANDVWQCSLLVFPRNFLFEKYESSFATYDIHFEWNAFKFIKEKNPILKDYDFELDLLGAKCVEEIKNPYVLTTQKVKNNELEFGDSFKPIELNILLNQSGNKIALTKKENLKQAWFIRMQNTYRPYYYSWNKMVNKLLIKIENILR